MQAKLIVTVEEHNIIGGLGSAVSEVMSEINHTQKNIFRNKRYLRQMW